MPRRMPAPYPVTSRARLSLDLPLSDPARPTRTFSSPAIPIRPSFSLYSSFVPCSGALALSRQHGGDPLKAFLSHSSKDKCFVGQVAAALGNLQVEYDEKTFDLTLNVQAIRRSLSRSDLFVVFLSANSIASPFVAEEERSALEARGRGLQKNTRGPRSRLWT